MYKNIILDKTQAGIPVLSINRPAALNALNTETLKEMLAALTELEADASLRCLVITGAGEKAFVAGADISEMKGLNVLEGYEFGKLGHAVCSALERLKVPVIAAVNGFALGGGTELSLSCDMVIASEKAKFGQPEVNLGVIPGFGGTQRLVRAVGRTAAKYLIYTGDIIDANEALRIGLVNKVVPPANLMEEAMNLARKISDKGPVAIRNAKRSMLLGEDMGLRAGLDLEKGIFAEHFATEDQKEGMTAFVEKRKPQFKNK